MGCAAPASHARRVVSITRAAFADIARCARLEPGVVSVMWTSCRREHCNCESFSLTSGNFGEQTGGDRRDADDEDEGVEKRHGALALLRDATHIKGRYKFRCYFQCRTEAERAAGFKKLPGAKGDGFQ